MAISILVALVFSKYVYLSSLTSYYTFYLIDRFHVSVQSAQLHLFLLLFAVAVGTIVGGPVGDRIGRKKVIWCSILGVAPFSLLLPHVGLEMTAVHNHFFFESPRIFYMHVHGATDRPINWREKLNLLST